MKTTSDEFLRERQRERRSRRAATGPCLLCGTVEVALVPGRDAGVHVYCPLCAIGTRTPATLEQ
jgi:hypothetical protein